MSSKIEDFWDLLKTLRVLASHPEGVRTTTKSSGIGISTLCLAEAELGTALEYLVGRTELVEIVSEGYHDITKHLEVAESFSGEFKYSIHSPYIGLDIANIREALRRESLEVIEGTLKSSSELNPVMFVVHPGMIAGKHLKEDNAKALKKSVTYLNKLSEEYSIPIALENMPLKFLFLTKPEEIELIDGLKFCLDVGHANITKKLDEFLLVERIDHVHLHDNGGNVDEHLGIGKGKIDMKKVFRGIYNHNPKPNIILELANGDDVDPSIKKISEISHSFER